MKKMYLLIIFFLFTGRERGISSSSGDEPSSGADDNEEKLQLSRAANLSVLQVRKIFKLCLM